MSAYWLMGMLLTLSFFFSASETALFSLDRQQVSLYAASRNPLRRLVARLLSEPRQLLVTILFGNLTVNVCFYGVASFKAIEFARADHPLGGMVFCVLTPVVVIVVGEVTPKALALGFSEGIATAAAPVLYFLMTLLWPFRVVIARFTHVLSHVIAGRYPRATYVTPEELKMLIATSERQGVIDRNESVMMQELVDFGRVLVRDVMRPRVDMVMCRQDASVDELVSIIRRTGHSVVPVYGNSADDLVGIVDSHEVLLDPDRPLREFLQRIYFVPETKTVESLLAEFRRQHRTFAVVVDEYGGTAGTVTLEDVVETIVGEIYDEYDRPETTVSELGENRYLLSGRLSIADWTEMFGLPVEARRLATLGGLVIKLLGHLPREGEQVRYGNIRFTVNRMRKRGVEEVLVEYVEAAPEDGGRS